MGQDLFQSHKATITGAESVGIALALEARADVDMLLGLGLTDSIALSSPALTYPKVWRPGHPLSAGCTWIKAALEQRQLRELDTGISWVRAQSASQVYVTTRR